MVKKEDRTPISASFKAKVQLVAIVVILLLSWHLALTVTSEGMSVGDVGRTLRGLITLRPMDLGPEVTTGPVWLVLILTFLPLVLLLVGLFWFLDRRFKRRTEEGMAKRDAFEQSMNRGGHGQLSPIGFYMGKPVRPSAEDTSLIYGIPRSGKTAYLVAGSVKDAPGPVVVTSTKVDVLRLTAKPRSEVGKVWVFDPEGVSRWPETMRWNIVAGCEDYALAGVRARAMVKARPVGDAKNGAFFEQAAETVLRCLLHAAALDGRTMRDVMRWARDFEDETAREILRTNDEAAPGADRDLTKFTTGAADETVASTDMSLALVLGAFTIPSVLATVLPSDDDDAFDPDDFVVSTDTLYLLSEGGDGSAAPLLTALCATITRSARRTSQHTSTGRLPHDFVLELDECPSIAPIPDLPWLMSDGGGRGILTRAYGQAPSQFETRYGRETAATLFTSSALRLILPGLADDAFLRAMSALVGERRVARSRRSVGGDREDSYSLEREKESTMTPEDIRTLPDATALLLYRNQAGAVIKLRGWWDRPDADCFKDSQVWVLDKEEGLA